MNEILCLVCLLVFSLKKSHVHFSCSVNCKKSHENLWLASLPQDQQQTLYTQTVELHKAFSAPAIHTQTTAVWQFNLGSSYCPDAPVSGSKMNGCLY